VGELSDTKKEVFSRALVKEGFNASAAARQCNMSEHSGITLARSNEIRTRTRELMLSQGMSLSDIVSSHKSLLSAEKGISTKYGIEYVPDNAVRLGATKLAYEIWGSTQQEKKEVDVAVTHKVETSAEELSELKDIIGDLKDLRSGASGAVDAVVIEEPKEEGEDGSSG